jgi:energy-converting hydrogenase Eha subunit A
MDHENSDAVTRIDGIREAVASIAQHELIRLVDRYHDEAGLPAGAILHMQFADDNGELTYPTTSIKWEDTPAVVIGSAERAHELAHSRFVFVSTLRKIAFGIASLAAQPISDYQALVAIEYHAENYFVRLSAAVEQLHRVVAAVLGLPMSERDTLRHLSRSIADASPIVAAGLETLRNRLRDSKARRNEVAHCAEFDDERLDGLRAHVTPALEFLPNSDPWMQHVTVLQRYREEFLTDACEEFCDFIQDVSSVFDGAIPMARQKLQIAHTPIE